VEFELVIFDLDGTLIDTRQDIANAANEMLAHYGLQKKSVDELTGYVGDGIEKFVERCVATQKVATQKVAGSRVDLDEAADLFKGFYAERLMEFSRPYPGIVDLLQRMNGVRKAILTNKAYGMSKSIADGLGISGFFELLVGGDSLPRKKPFPDGILYILEKTGVARKHSLMVGDGPNDIVTAREAGVSSVYVSWGFSDERNLDGLKPTLRVDRPEELLAILRGS
jgi:phosphoglycolate phosphatase